MIKKLARNKLLVNSFFLISSAAAHSITGFVFYIIIARLFSAEDLGLSVNLLTSLSLVMVLSHFGFSESIIKFYKKSREKENLIGTSIFVSGLLSLFFAFAILVLMCIKIPSMIVFFSNYLAYAFLFLIMSSVWSISILFDSIYIAMERAEYVLIKTLIFSFFKVMLPFVFISLGFFGIYSSWTIAALISLILMQKIRKFSFKLSINVGLLRKVISFSFVNYIGNISYWLRNFLVPFIITLVYGAASAAFFYVPLRLLDLMLIVPKSTGRALFAQGSKNKKSKGVAVAFFLSIASSFFFIFVFFAFGVKLLSVYGMDYVKNSFAVLKVLSVYGLFMAINEILLTQAQHNSDSKEILTIRVLSSMLSLASLLYLSKYGLIGFAYAFLFGEAIAFIFVVISRINLNSIVTGGRRK